MLGGVAAYLDHDWSLLKCHCRPLVAVPARVGRSLDHGSMRCHCRPLAAVPAMPLQTAGCGPGNPRACL